MIFAVLRSMLFNLMFISFSVSDICLSTINVDSKTSTRWRKDSDVETSISSIDLLRSKLLISSVRCSLRLFKENSFKVVRILVRTSRRLMSDDITSIRAENLYVFQTIDILRDQVISTSRVWLLWFLTIFFHERMLIDSQILCKSSFMSIAKSSCREIYILWFVSTINIISTRLLRTWLNRTNDALSRINKKIAQNLILINMNRIMKKMRINKRQDSSSKKRHELNERNEWMLILFRMTRMKKRHQLRKKKRRRRRRRLRKVHRRTTKRRLNRRKRRKRITEILNKIT